MTKQRRYLFPDRQSAEIAYRLAKIRETEHSRALSAVIDGRVRDMPQVGPYLVGLYGTRFELHVIIRQPAAAGFAPIPHEAEALCLWIDGTPDTVGAGEFDADLRRVAYHVRRIQARYWCVAPDEMKDAPAVLVDLIADEFPADSQAIADQAAATSETAAA